MPLANHSQDGDKPNLNPIEILKKYWGFSSFRALQEDIINSVLNGKDALALMPTGGGKSLCFQVPALVKDGLCLVVSPLIALMKDQVYNLKKKGIKAEAIYSGMSKHLIGTILDNAVYGDVKLLYVSPERLQTKDFLGRLPKMPINLIAVDEAHCISQWGYDFRPPYLKIADIRSYHPKVPVLALTATATTDVIKDIQEKLKFKKENVFRKSFKRDNLAYIVKYEDAKLNKTVEILNKVKGSSIVYVRNRRKTKEIADYLNQNGINADYYHAGLTPEMRERKQEDWITEKNRVIVSTNAFGMGIDKANVRSVIHIGLPDSIEAYFQEAGRAARDGKKAFAVILVNHSDKIDVEQALEKSMPSVAEVKQVYNALGNFFQLATGSGKDQSFDFDLSSFCKQYSLPPLKVIKALKFLEQFEYLTLSDGIKTSSKFWLRTNKQQLYKLQVENKQYEPILKAILRSYEGVLTHYTSIDEISIAKQLNTKPAIIKQALTNLERNHLAFYEPTRSKPFITFLTERIDSINLRLDNNFIIQQKETIEGKLKAMLSYVSRNDLCRSVQLLEYFGEHNSARCGICDVCLELNKTNISDIELDTVIERIKEELEIEPHSIPFLVSALDQIDENKLLKAIEWLMDNDRVVKNDENKLVWIK